MGTSISVFAAEGNNSVTLNDSDYNSLYDLKIQIIKKIINI